MKYSDYQLRYAAGSYWLINTKQCGFRYIKPLCLNECGAYIWQMLCKGFDENKIADEFCQKFGIGQEEALKDAKDFIEQLNKCCTAD